MSPSFLFSLISSTLAVAVTPVSIKVNTRTINKASNIKTATTSIPQGDRIPSTRDCLWKISGAPTYSLMGGKPQFKLNLEHSGPRCDVKAMLYVQGTDNNGAAIYKSKVNTVPGTTSTIVTSEFGDMGLTTCVAAPKAPDSKKCKIKYSVRLDGVGVYSMPFPIVIE